MPGQERGVRRINANASIANSESSQLLDFALNGSPGTKLRNAQVVPDIKASASRKQDVESQSTVPIPTRYLRGPMHAQDQSHSADSHAIFDEKTTHQVGSDIQLVTRVVPQLSRIMGPPVAQKETSNRDALVNTSSLPNSSSGLTVLQDAKLGAASTRQFKVPFDDSSRGSIQNVRSDKPRASSYPVDESQEKSVSSQASRYSLSTTSFGDRILIGYSDSSGPSQDSLNPLNSQLETQNAGSSNDSCSGPTQLVTQSLDDGKQDVSQVLENGVNVDNPEITHKALAAISNPQSLFSLMAPEKRYKYYLNSRKGQNEGLQLADVSQMATIGSFEINESIDLRASSPVDCESPKLDDKEEIVQDSLSFETSYELSLLRPTRRSCDEVILPSESDAADGSRDFDEIEDSALTGLPQKPNMESEVKEPRNKSPSKVASRPSSKQSIKSNTYQAESGGLENRVKKTSKLSAGPSKVYPHPSNQDDLPATRKPISRQEPAQITKSVSKNSKGKTRKEVLEPAKDQNSCPVTPTTGLSYRTAKSGESSPSIPLAHLHAQRMEEEETEIAEDEQMDVDVLTPEPASELELELEPKPRSRKRKHAGGETKKNSKTKVSPSPRKGSGRSQTAFERPPSKRSRTSHMSKTGNVIARFGAGVGTQIFAPFKSDNFYYGAEVQQIVNEQRAHIKFFDDLEDNSSWIRNLRKFQLKVDDTITLLNNKRATVVDDSRWATDNEVTAVYYEDDEEVSVTINARDVRIAARTIQSQWKDRCIELSEIVPAVQRKLSREMLSPSKLSMMSTQSVSKPLAGYAVVVTLGPRQGNSAISEKEQYQKIVKSNGGTVLNDWTDIYSMQGKHTYSNKRFVLTREDVKFAPKDKNLIETSERVFLVSDIHNQKSRYLIALALGIPCVSLEWLDALLRGEEEPWTRHLLAAGYSEFLGASMSQLVDLNWGESIEHMTEIMENSTPLKLLSGKSVICIGKDTFPDPPKKNNKDAQEARRSVPRIIIAMGAERVEAVVDADHASDRSLDNYDYIVTDRPDESDPRYVNVDWIKQCLIAGRLLEMPN